MVDRRFVDGLLFAVVWNYHMVRVLIDDVSLHPFLCFFGWLMQMYRTVKTSDKPGRSPGWIPNPSEVQFRKFQPNETASVNCPFLVGIC